MAQYADDMRTAFAKLERHAQRPRKAAIFQETGAQHFKVFFTLS